MHTVSTKDTQLTEWTVWLKCDSLWVAYRTGFNLKIWACWHLEFFSTKVSVGRAKGNRKKNIEPDPVVFPCRALPCHPYQPLQTYVPFFIFRPSPLDGFSTEYECGFWLILSLILTRLQRPKSKSFALAEFLIGSIFHPSCPSAPFPLQCSWRTSRDLQWEDSTHLLRSLSAL